MVDFFVIMNARGPQAQVLSDYKSNHIPTGRGLIMDCSRWLLLPTMVILQQQPMR